MTQITSQNPLGPAVTVKITHSHTHSHDDHGHSHDSVDSDASQPEKHEAADHQESSDSHTHTLMIAASAAMTVPQRIAIAFDRPVQTIQNPAAEMVPPSDPHLNGIFRPPIQA